MLSLPRSREEGGERSGACRKSQTREEEGKAAHGWVVSFGGWSGGGRSRRRWAAPRAATWMRPSATSGSGLVYPGSFLSMREEWASGRCKSGPVGVLSLHGKAHRTKRARSKREWQIVLVFLQKYRAGFLCHLVVVQIALVRLSSVTMDSFLQPMVMDQSTNGSDLQLYRRVLCSFCFSVLCSFCFSIGEESMK